jgi:hypothetical protein
LEGSSRNGAGIGSQSNSWTFHWQTLGISEKAKRIFRHILNFPLLPLASHLISSDIADKSILLALLNKTRLLMGRILIKQAPDLTAHLGLIRPIAVTALYASITTITWEWNETALELTGSQALLNKNFLLPDLEGWKSFRRDLFFGPSLEFYKDIKRGIT